MLQSRLDMAGGGLAYAPVFNTAYKDTICKIVRPAKALRHGLQPTCLKIIKYLKIKKNIILWVNLLTA